MSAACVQCGKELEVTREHGRFCSSKCRAAATQHITDADSPTVVLDAKLTLLRDYATLQLEAAGVSLNAAYQSAGSDDRAMIIAIRQLVVVVTECGQVALDMVELQPGIFEPAGAGDGKAE